MLCIMDRIRREVKECIYAGFICVLPYSYGLWRNAAECVFAGREDAEIPLKKRSCHTLRKKQCMIRTQHKTNTTKYSILADCSQYADLARMK